MVPVFRVPPAVLAFALLLAVITSLPYAASALNTPDDWAYSGAAAYPTSALVDYNSYLAAMRLGAQGHWAYELRFTHEDHPPIRLVKGFRVALGWTTRVTGFSLPLTYHLARFLLTFGTVLVLWALAAHFFVESTTRWMMVLFATVVGGWSWLVLVLPLGQSDISPIEFWLIDAFNLLGMFYAMHFALALILQAATVLAYERWIMQGGARPLVILTLALAGLSIVQPYILPLTSLLIGLMTTYHLFLAPDRLSWRRALWLVIPLTVHAAPVLYQYFAMQSDDIWRGFVEQNDTLSPPVVYYLLGYLPLLIPAALSLRTSQRHLLIAWVWIALVALLLYLPLPTQRRYTLGLQSMLAIPAAAGWVQVLLARMKHRRHLLVTMIYLIFASISLLLMIGVNILAAFQPKENTHIFWQPDDRAGYRWLIEHSDPDAVILTTFEGKEKRSGGALVAATGRRVYVGHWVETVDFEHKKAQVERFYDSATTDAWRCAFLHEIGSAYVWDAQPAREAGAWQPDELSCLNPVFRHGAVAIFQVMDR